MQSRPTKDGVGHAKKSMKPVEVGPENLIEFVAPPAPTNLGSVGVEIWDGIWLLGKDVFNVESDHWVIERYASMQERRYGILDDIDKAGYLVPGSQGQDVLNPLVRVLQDLEQKLIALEDRLGLSPEARLRLGITAADHKSKLDEFLEET